MIKMKIGFWGIDSILEFVKITAGCKDRIELVCGNYAVNGKSLLSVLSMRSLQEIDLIIHSESCDELLKQLDPYIEHGRMLFGSRHMSA